MTFYGSTEKDGSNATVVMLTCRRAKALCSKHASCATEQLGTLDPPATPTFREFVEGSFTALVMPQFRPATRVRYEALFRQGLLDHFGALRLDAVGPDAVLSFAAKLATREVQMKGPVMLLKTVLRAATELGLLSVMPRVPRVWTESRKLPDAPSPGGR